jgi:CubicO group peptidase (beta-lactamase class C family)
MFINIFNSTEAAMKTFLKILFFFLLVTQICFAQLEFFNNEQKQNTSFEQLTDNFTVNLDSLMLDSIITAYMNSENIPGAATLIIKNNEVVWNKNYGYRNLENQLPVDDSTLFLMASISKTILATAIMQLWENGLIELNNSINEYLPSGFTVVNPHFPSDTITVKMIMTHTSSIQDSYFLDNLWSCGDYPVTFESFLVNYFTPGGTYYSLNNFYNYHPGQNWNYSNAGSCLLALMVEHLTGKSFNEYTRDSIFTPLSMNSSSWFFEGLDINIIATPYMYRPPTPMCHTGFAYWPIGQLRTNKYELSNFLSAYMNGGLFNNNRILNNSTIQLMLSDQTGLIGIDGGTQGLIWYTDPIIYNTIWGHSGGWYGAETYMCFNPQEKWGFTFFINWASPTNYSVGFFPTSIQLAKYAHLFGNIYALRSSVDKSYARKNIDPVLFRTNFSNIYNHQFTPHLVFANTDSTQIDSLTLFDDGLHSDSLSNDGIYGNYIPPQQNENFYFVGVSTIDNQTNKYFRTPDLCRFTTAGPLVVDSVLCVHFPAMKRFSIKPYITNFGNSLPITGVTLKIKCNDIGIINFAGGATVTFPNIPVGSTVISNTVCSISYDSTYQLDSLHLKFEIMSGGYTYWKDILQVIISPVGVEEELNPLPQEFSLSQNYPNPFNSSSVIKYSIPKSSLVTLKIFNILGEEIEILVNKEKPVGTYEVNWNASNLPSGVYFYRLQVVDPEASSGQGFVQTRKMILLK